MPNDLVDNAFEELLKAVKTMNSNDQTLMNRLEEMIEDTESRNGMLEKAISEMIKNKTSNGEKMDM